MNTVSRFVPRLTDNLLMAAFATVAFGTLFQRFNSKLFGIARATCTKKYVAMIAGGKCARSRRVEPVCILRLRPHRMRSC